MDTFIITLPPRQLPTLRGWQVTPAHLAYRLGPGPHLFRADSAAPRFNVVVVLPTPPFWLVIEKTVCKSLIAFLHCA